MNNDQVFCSNILCKTSDGILAMNIRLSVIFLQTLNNLLNFNEKITPLNSFM